VRRTQVGAAQGNAIVRAGRAPHRKGPI
jgi:hypothetical protein